MTRKEEIEQAVQKNKFGDFHSQVAYEFGFQQGAEWADKSMIDKACKAFCDVCLTEGCEKHLEGCIWLNRFEQAMKGE